MTRRPALDLILVSGLILFLELACIRWFPAHVLFLSFFTNVVLLAGFVGMSVGCLLARRPTRHLRHTPAWLAAALACGLLVSAYHGKLERHLDVGAQADPEVVFFGAETSSLKPVEFAVPVELVAGAFYFLIAAAMVGPGQELGRAFNRVPGRSTAYSLNLLGSLAGIGLFAGCSELSLPPVVWFTLVAAGLGYLLLRPVPGPARRPLLLLALVVILSAATSGPFDGSVWSPYYRIRMNPADRILTTNLISHQVMTSRTFGSTAAYDLPYLFARDTGRPPYRRILVIGAGSGNDLSRALYWSPPDARIDAVEIDPAIRKIGGEHHPDRPYDDPRITTHLTDGRTFLRTAPAGEYDLVIFALVDSLVLHSGASNIRLESYLFTREAFADVARVLKPTGTAAVYNFFRHGWIVARLRDGMRTAFGADPVVLTDPPADRVELNRFDSAFTAVFAGREESIAPLRQKFAGNNYWVPHRSAITRDTPCRFGPEPPAGGEWVRLRAAEVEESAGLPPATDDWPFLYVRRPAVPAQTWRGTGLVVALSLAVWLVFRGRPGGKPLSAPEGGDDDRGSDSLPSPLAGEGLGVRGDGAEYSVPSTQYAVSSGHGEPPQRAGEADRSVLRTEYSVPADSPDAPRSETGLAIRSFLLGAGFMLIETRAVVEMALLFGSTWVVNTVVFAAVLAMSLAGNLFAAWARPRALWPYYLGLFAALAVNLAVPAEAFLGWPRTGQVLASCLLAFAPVGFAGVIFAASFGRARAADRVFAANVAGALFGGLAENVSLVLGFRWLLLVAGGLYLASGLVRGQRCALPRHPVRYNEDGVWCGRLAATGPVRLLRRLWARHAPAAHRVPPTDAG